MLPSGELDETYAYIGLLYNVHSLHYVKTWRQPQNQEYLGVILGRDGGPDLHVLEVGGPTPTS